MYEIYYKPCSRLAPTLTLTLYVTLTLTDLVTPYFICPLAHKLVNRGKTGRWVRECKLSPTSDSESACTAVIVCLFMTLLNAVTP